MKYNCQIWRTMSKIFSALRKMIFLFWLLIFSFANNETFKLKYLINDTYWKDSGPIFFYTGNEGPIEVFAQNSGFIWEIAPSFNALIVFAEHRYLICIYFIPHIHYTFIAQVINHYVFKFGRFKTCLIWSIIDFWLQFARVLIP